VKVVHKVVVNLNDRIFNMLVERAEELSSPKNVVVSLALEEYFKKRGDLINENSKSKN